MAGNFQAAFCRRQHLCSRHELKAPILIFAGLFLLATSVRALETSAVTAVTASPSIASDEVKVLRAGTPLTPVDADLMMGGCHSTRSAANDAAAGQALPSLTGQAVRQVSLKQGSKKFGRCQASQTITN